MARYQSVDALQNALAHTVFKDTTSAKKAAGRALGVLVELITFYMIRDWELEDVLAIERGLSEYGNGDITHNVEFSLHPALQVKDVPVLDSGKSITPTQIIRGCEEAKVNLGSAKKRSTNLLTKNELRHAATFAEEDGFFWVANMQGRSTKMRVSKLKESPYAMFECKRVGIEEGMKKGPQTIEKAKQGAYVARTVSGLQRVPRNDGRVSAVMETASGDIETHENYYTFLREAITSGDKEKLANVVLTVGIVSNHGNWFTAETQNKEMRVLAQSYDWLLFLTDNGLAEFIEDVLQGDDEGLEHVREAFKKSFGSQKGKTRFTKVCLDAHADRELTEYFRKTRPWDRWFNVIAPAPAEHEGVREADAEEQDAKELEEVAKAVSLDELKRDLHRLREIHGV